MHAVAERQHRTTAGLACRLRSASVDTSNAMLLLCVLLLVQVYRRSGKDRATLLRESRSRNNSLEDVLARQKAQFGDT